MSSPRPHSPFKFIHTARRHALLIIIPAIIVTVASAIAIKKLPDLYESSARMTIELHTGEAAPLEPSRRVAMLRQQLTNRARLEELIAKHDLYRDLKASGGSTDEIVNRFRSDIRIEADSRDDAPANTFTVFYRARDGATAQKLTAELASLLAADSAKAATPQSPDETAMLRQRAAELAAQLREFETTRPWLLNLKEDALLAAAPQPSRTPPAPADTSRAQQFLVDGYRDRQYALQQQMADVEQRILEQKRIVDQQKKGGALANNPTYAILLAKRAELQGQRDNLINRQELTDKHPRVLLITDQLAAIDRQLADLRQQEAGTTSQSPEARELRSLESERNRIKVELEVTNRAIARQAANSQPTARPTPATTDVAGREGLYGRVAQEYFAVKHAHKEMVAALERADARRPAADSKPEQLRVLEQANLPVSPVYPNRGMLHLIALAAGLAVGACFAAVAESRRSRSLHDSKDVERYTNLPMLVAIPKTLTEQERKRAARTARLRLVFGAAAVAVAVFALTKFLIVTNLFAIIGEK
jgi:capsular polysaccharide biosynthesis protein